MLPCAPLRPTWSAATIARTPFRASVALGLAVLVVLAFAQPASTASSFAVAFLQADTPSSMQAGRTYLVHLELQNTGSDTWKAGPFRVSYHWLAPATGSVVVADGLRTALPRDVAPGDRVRLCASVLAPADAGPMTLQWDLVEEGVSWLSQVSPANAYSQPITVSPGLAVPPGSARVALFFAVTLAHFVLVFFWLGRVPRLRRDPDAFLFHSIVVGLGTLMSALNAVAFTVGLSLARGVAALVILHVAAAVVHAVHRRRSRGPRPAAMVDADPPEDVPSPVPLVSIAGLVVVAALVIGWVIAASHSLRIVGSDAAHYHVPNAVNIALGANPFGLPATPHLYPMGTSVLAAWFILPFGDPLLVDLTTVLPFLLAWSALLMLFRLASGQSGVAWGPWCALPLFTLPLFRAALPMSADLFYTAAFLALNAGLLRACLRFRVDGIEAVSLALSAGMLLGTKATGLFSTVTLCVAYGSVLVGARLVRGGRLRLRGPSPWHAALSAVLLIAAGGIWIVRNWWTYGSPLAPAGMSLLGVPLFEGATYQSTMYYVSVLKDMRDTANYNAMGRLLYWSREWLGSWFLLSGVLVLGLVLDVINVRRTSGRLSEAARAKAILLIASIVLSAAHLFLLAGVPWSSLEWSKGSSLRYALPSAALYGLLAYTACFPESIPWWRRFGARAGFVVMAAAIGLYAVRQGVPGLPATESVGRLTPLALLLSVALLVLTLGARRLAHGWTRGVLAAAGVGVLAVGAAVQASRNDQGLMSAAQSAFDQATTCGTGLPGPNVGKHRGTYLNLVLYERSAGIACQAHRMFTTTRWDLPLELQPAGYLNQVFDMRGPTFRPWLLRWARPGAGSCDYIVASKEELKTVRGVPLINAIRGQVPLKEVAEYGPYAVYAARAAGTPAQ